MFYCIASGLMLKTALERLLLFEKQYRTFLKKEISEPSIESYILLCNTIFECSVHKI